MTTNLIAGEWRGARSGATFARHNPADLDDVVGVFPDSGAQDVADAVAGAVAGVQRWAETSPEERARVLERAADHLEAHADTLIAELVREEGKTLAEASTEVGRTPANLRFHAGEAVRSGGATFPAANGDDLILTVRQPVGVVGVITPWNFPLNIPSRKIGPALAAGNAVVYKPSEVTPLLGCRLVEALLAGGLPPDVIALVQGSGAAGAALVADERVDAITFTGSTAVGRAIHSASGPRRRVQLELGGKNPAVVLPDADLDRAAAAIAAGAFGLSGQACTGTSRVVVHRDVHDALLERLVEAARSRVVGPGATPGVTMGPLANQTQYDKFVGYVHTGLAEGAGLITDWRADEVGKGHFVRPAVFRDVTPGMRIAREEVFGPLLCVTAVASFEEAVAVAGDTGYGLSAAIHTNDLSAALRFARHSRTGLVKVNQATTGMAMNAPFGGWGDSGTQTDKEQAGASLMNFYQSEKTVYLVP